jgi:hypothetical protein
MNPTLLHQIADDRVIERRRYHQVHDRGPRRPRHRVRIPARLRMAAGGLLIAAGTRLVGTRAGPAGLHRSETT